MPDTYPPESKEPFKTSTDGHDAKGNKIKVDIEKMAEGFRMSFKVSGLRKFKAAIKLPTTAKPGPYMFDFYVSVYGKVPGSGSIVETGLSYSDKGKWKFMVNAGGHDPRPPFGGNPFGQTVHLLAELKRPPKAGGPGQIAVTIGGQTVPVPWLHPEPIDHIRLVAASGNTAGAEWDSATMTLETVDGELPNGLIGHPEWIHGADVTAANRRLKWLGGMPHGFTCSLPPG